MFERQLTPVVTELLAEFRIVYLTGPRQAGKTTLTKIIAQNDGFEYVSFDNQTILQSAQNDIKLFALPINLFIKSSAKKDGDSMFV